MAFMSDCSGIPSCSERERGFVRASPAPLRAVSRDLLTGDDVAPLADKSNLEQQATTAALCQSDTYHCNSLEDLASLVIHHAFQTPRQVYASGFPVRNSPVCTTAFVFCRQDGRG